MTSAEKEPWRVQHELKQHKGSVHCAVFNANGNFLLTGGQDRKIILWNASKGTAIKTFEKHAYEVLGVCACVRGSLLLL
jgi:WD40 repeat protein